MLITALGCLLFWGNVAFTHAQTPAPEYTLFAIRTNASAQVTVEKNGFNASAHTDQNNIAVLKVDNPAFDMSGQEVRVGSVYPNPSSAGRVAIDFSIPRAMTVHIAVFDVLGKPAISRMEQSFTDAGVYQLALNLGNNSSGIYFLRLHFPQKTFLRKFTLLRKGSVGTSVFTFLGRFDFNPAENRFRPITDPSGLDTATIRIIPDDTGKYAPLDTVMIYDQPAFEQDTVSFYLPMKEIDAVTYMLRAFLTNGPHMPNKEFSGYIELGDGARLPINGRYDNNPVTAQHIGVDAKKNSYARVVITSDSTKGLETMVTSLPPRSEKDLGAFGIDWNDYPPEFLPTFTDTIRVRNGSASIYRDSTAWDFNNDIDNMAITNLPSGDIEQSYNRETGELTVKLNGYKSNFDATLRVTDKAGNTISTPLHFKVTPDTVYYRFRADLTNGPPSQKGYRGMMVFSNGDSVEFTGKFHNSIIVPHHNKNMPSVEDYIIRSIFATDSTEATQDTLRRIANADTVDLDEILVKWMNYPPEFSQQPASIDTLEDHAGKTRFHATDFNMDTLKYSLNNLPEGFTYEIVNDLLVITPPANYNGTIEGLTLTVSDNQYTRTSEPFSVSWKAVNDPPITSVPDQTVPRRGQIVIDLNQYVNDPDNTPNEMKWQAADYDTSLVDIVIDSLNTAVIKSRGPRGSTPILWIATDPQGAEGQNSAMIETAPSNMLRITLQDPVDDAVWGNTPFNVILYNEANPDTIRLITDSSGQASIYTFADSGRIVTPLNDSLYQTIQGFKGLKSDTGLVVPVVYTDYPLEEFIKIQAGVWYQGYSGAFVTSWDPAFFNKGKNGDPDTLRMAYYEKSPQDNMIAVLRDSIISWNEKYFRKMTPNWVLEPPKIGHNVEFYYPESLQDEGAKSREIWDADTLPNNAAMGWLIYHYGMTPSNASNDIPHNPAGPFYATRGKIVTQKLAYPEGTHFEESATALQTANGEVNKGAWAYTVYGGGSAWPPFRGKGLYKGKEYVLEVLIGELKYGVEPGTEIRPTRIILPVKNLSR